MHSFLDLGGGGGRIEERDGWGWGWGCGGRCLTVVCVCESNLPPSAVRVGDVRATEAPGPPSFSLSFSLSVPPSLHWQCHVVSTHMLVCSGGGVGCKGCRGGRAEGT